CIVSGALVRAIAFERKQAPEGRGGQIPRHRPGCVTSCQPIVFAEASAYSTKVGTGFANRIRASYWSGAFSWPLTGIQLAGNAPMRLEALIARSRHGLSPHHRCYQLCLQ